MLDISEEPRCGRVAESLGEAPVLAGRLGAATVRGVQGEPDSGTATDSAGAAIGCAGTIAAGMDIDMVSGAYAARLAELVEAGQVPLDLVDDAARRVIRLKMRQGLFERPYVGTPTSAPAPGSTPSAPIPEPTARALAREAAAASFVLLSNKNTQGVGILPLAPNPGRVLLTGPFAHEGEAFLGTWTLGDGRFSDRTMHLVRQADVTVALVGEHPSRSGEANSVASIGLPAGQLEVLRAMAAIGKPLVVVMFAGRPLDLGEVLDLADAVLIAWHPGVEAGPALIETLFGDRSQGGRLPMTFPRSLGHLPSSSLARPTGRPIDAANDARTGRYLDALVVPRLPFGSGLTYTTFNYGPLRLSAREMPLHGGSIEVSIDVTNVGERAGREVVQLYLRDVAADLTRPLLELADWVSLVLDAGAIGTATFTVTPAQLSYYDRTMTLRIDLAKPSSRSVRTPSAAPRPGSR